jgi:hypothetical protein
VIGPGIDVDLRWARVSRRTGHVGRPRGPIPEHSIIPDGRKGVSMSTLSDFEMTSITGESISLSSFENQVCLIVNVASE